MNPCSTALEADHAAHDLAERRPGEHQQENVDRRQPARPRVRGHVDSSGRRRGSAAQRRPAECDGGDPASPRRRRSREDVGDIAVVQDSGDLILPRAHLRSASAPACASRATARPATTSRRSTANFRSALGTQPDARRRRQRVRSTCRSRFRSTARSQTAAFVNSDGNITFGEADQASTERDVVAPADRPAARRAVPRRPRSDGRRARSSSTPRRTSTP